MIARTIDGGPRHRMVSKAPVLAGGGGHRIGLVGPEGRPNRAQSVSAKSAVFDPLATVTFSPEVSGFSYFGGVSGLRFTGFVGT